MKYPVFFGFLFFLLSVGRGPVWGRVFLTQEQALGVAFSSATPVERKNIYLTTDQKISIEQAARSKLESALVTYYVGTNTSGITNVALFSSHIVRTMPEALMVVLNPDGTINFVEILAFYEPEDYLPPKKWFGLFQNRKLADDLWVKRGIRNITGATLSTQAITKAVREILATYEVAIKPTLRTTK